MAGSTSHLVSKKKLPSQKMIQSLATSPLPDILLRDPQEDPVPPISEDLTSVRLFPGTTSLLQEIWVTKQRTNRQLLVKKAYRWMVIEEQEQLATRTGRISKPTQKRAPEPSAGTHIQQENTQLDSLDSFRSGNFTLGVFKVEIYQHIAFSLYAMMPPSRRLACSSS